MSAPTRRSRRRWRAPARARSRRRSPRPPARARPGTRARARAACGRALRRRRRGARRRRARSPPIDLLRRPAVAAEPRAARRRHAAPVGAAEQAGGEREVGDEGHARGARPSRACRRSRAPSSPSGSRSRRLYSFWTTAKPRSRSSGRRRGGLLELRGREVGAADLAHQAAREQPVHHLERLDQRSPRIGLVVVVEVEMVGAQTAQAGLERLRHPVGLPAAAPRRAVVAELGGDDHLVATRRRARGRGTPPTARRRRCRPCRSA